MTELKDTEPAGGYVCPQVENLCYDFCRIMGEATEKKEVSVISELDMPKWSVVSFDICEASGLTYADAVHLLADKERAGVYGLCIITDEAAARMDTA